MTGSTKTGIYARIIKAIEESEAPPTARMIADAAGLDCRAVSRNLGKLARATTVTHAANSGKGAKTTWVICKAQEEAKQDLAQKADWTGQVAAPRDRSVMDGVCAWKFATAARPDAAEHEKIPSRRGDERVPHRPLMLMGSSVRGEFGK
jgi:hypothetical protein